MNKKEFLEQLEKKLVILDEKERAKIIKKIGNDIDKEVTDIKKEKDIVKEYGEINEIAETILKEHKIDTKYTKTFFQKTEEVIDKSNDIIHTWAIRISRWLGDFIDEIKRNHTPLSLSLIVELTIKFIFVLILLLVLKIPFVVIRGIGVDIIEMAFAPFSNIINFIWSAIIGIIFLALSAFLITIIFKKYFENISKEPKELERTKVEETDNVSKSICKAIFSLIFIFVFLIPLIGLNVALWFSLAIVLFLYFKGIELIGLVILIIGFIVLFGYLYQIIYQIAFNHKRIYMFPFLISLIFIITGFSVSINFIMNLEYSNTLPNNKYEIAQKTYNEELVKKTEIGFENKTIIIDNTLSPNEMIIEVNHYNEFTDVIKENIMTVSNSEYISIYSKRTHNYLDFGKPLFDMVIENLKNKKIYKYSKLFEIEVKVYINEDSKDLIK